LFIRCLFLSQQLCWWIRNDVNWRHREIQCNNCLWRFFNYNCHLKIIVMFCNKMVHTRKILLDFIALNRSYIFIKNTLKSTFALTSVIYLGPNLKRNTYIKVLKPNKTRIICLHNISLQYSCIQSEEIKCVFLNVIESCFGLFNRLSRSSNVIT